MLSRKIHFRLEEELRRLIINFVGAYSAVLRNYRYIGYHSLLSIDQ